MIIMEVITYMLQGTRHQLPVVCYEGSGSALLPVLEEATSEDSTLVIVFILTV